ncbi:hypothetical protein FOA52_003749 [Chlamydomonas sp. UWO 241]|nr:hypothetical protein FOA52_003749 [Chlamydomonas sp. UWO 241]
MATTLRAAAMTMPPAPGSSWHEGERALQQTVPGGREVADGIAKFLRTAMTEQHRDFFDSQHLIYFSREKPTGGMQAAVLSGAPGFASSPEPHVLLLALDRMDVHSHAIAGSLSVGDRIGMLGLQLHDRRRNRLNGHVGAVSADSVTIRVDQAYGNCPKYIQRRALTLAPQLDPSSPQPAVATTTGCGPLPPNIASFVRAADTFFVASSYRGSHARGVGADMSHRGGARGFVRVREGGGVLAWADYVGNGMFQTLGNLVTNPDCIHHHAGNGMFQTLENLVTNPDCSLLFLDYETGDVLTIDGDAQVVLDMEAVGKLPGAERIVTVAVRGWTHTAAAVPIASCTWIDASPYNPPDSADDVVGGGAQQAAAAAAGQQLEVLHVRDEAEGVETFTLAAPPGGASGLLAGMYAAFSFPAGSFGDGVPSSDVTRTWTVSSYHAVGELPAPSDGGSFTISVKREPGGLVSPYLHDAVAPGQSLRFLGFAGEFTLEALLDKRDTVPRAAVGEPEGVLEQPVVVMPAAGTAEAAGEGAQQAGGGADAGPGGGGRPVVLLSGGIGITPLRPFLAELQRAHKTRDVTMLLSVQTHAQAAFAGELLATARASGGRVAAVVTATRGGGGDSAGTLPEVGSLSREGVLAAGGGVRAGGRVTSSVLAALVGPRLSDAIVFMCGPGAFMGAMEEALEAAGVDARRVHQESFTY